MNSRRLLIALAVLIGLTALAAGLTTRPSEAPSPPAADARPAGAPPARTLMSRLSSATGARPTTIRARTGDTVQVTVAGPDLATVTIKELNKVEVIDRDSPARMEIYAEEPGSYPIVLLEPERRIGTLEIEAL